MVLRSDATIASSRSPTRAPIGSSSSPVSSSMTALATEWSSVKSVTLMLSVS